MRLFFNTSQSDILSSLSTFQYAVIRFGHSARVSGSLLQNNSLTVIADRVASLAR